MYLAQHGPAPTVEISHAPETCIFEKNSAVPEATNASLDAQYALKRQSSTSHILGDGKEEDEPCPASEVLYPDKVSLITLTMALMTAVFMIALDTNIIGN